MDITYGRATDIRSLYMIFSRITSSALMIEKIRRVEREIIHSTYMFCIGRSPYGGIVYIYIIYIIYIPIRAPARTIDHGGEAMQ